MNILLKANFSTRLKLITSAIILGVASIGFYFYIIVQDPPKEEHKLVNDIIEEDIDKYIDSIVSTKNGSNDTASNENFYKITDLLISKAINEKADELGLSKNQKEKIITAYYNSKTTIINGVHNEITERKDLKSKADISYEYLDSINGFSESIASVSCKLVSVANLSVPVKIAQGTLKTIVIDKKCKTFLTKYIEPLSDKLREKGIVKDTSIIVSKLESRVRASIVKLASAQDTITFEIDQTEKRNYDLWKIEFSRVSKLDAKIKATIIAGFDLSSYAMQVDHNKRTLDIHLPEPSIIASNTDIDFQEPSTELGSPKIDSETYNKINKRAKELALKEAKTEKIFDEARKSAYVSITNIFQPLMSLPQFNYKVNVYFDHNLYLDDKIKDNTSIPSI